MPSQNLSREYAKFKRTFIGPIMPRRIARKLNDVQQPRAARPKRMVLEHTDQRRLWDGAAMRRYATPKWANKDAIAAIYAECKRLTLETGKKYQVDHIIPVKHPLVCGLHVENNLRIMDAFENNIKSNTFTIM